MGLLKDIKNLFFGDKNKTFEHGFKDEYHKRIKDRRKKKIKLIKEREKAFNNKWFDPALN